MAWDAIDLRTKTGLPLSDADRETILDVAGKAILDSDQDPAVVIQAAKRVGRRLHIIQNLRAYATRAINAALHTAERKQVLKEQPVVQRNMEGIADLTRRDEIERRVLVREVLEHLPAQDREIFLRRMAGEPFSKIDGDLNLTPRTAETRCRAARRVMRRLLDEKFGQQTRARGV
jgi:DNA-directed RNA polymerase specialized sigma24 family protein